MACPRSPELDPLELTELASDPRALEDDLMSDAAAVLDGLGIERPPTATAEDLRAMLAAEFRKLRDSAQTDEHVPTWADVEEAIPGRLTPEELRNVLAGGTRKRHPG